MPIDKTYSDAMLGTFRNMMQECRDKKMSGKAFDTMSNTMNKMETFALEMDDLSAFTAKLTTEGLFTDFSTAYGEALAAEGQKKYAAAGSYDDNALLQQTLQAYENSLPSYKDHPDNSQ